MGGATSKEARGGARVLSAGVAAADASSTAMAASGAAHARMAAGSDRAGGDGGVRGRGDL